MPGPIPKRSDQRRRNNKPEVSISEAPSLVITVAVPASEETWHPIARDWFESLALSGQMAFYQPSDWQTARVHAELLSRQLESGKPSAMMIQVWSSAAAELLTTEGARRRARLELGRLDPTDADEDAAEQATNVYRAQFGA